MNAQAKATVEKLVIKKLIQAKREKVFEAWTDPKVMQKWFVPGEGWGAKSTVDLKVGGKYRHEMISEGGEGCSGEAEAKGTCYVHTGEYLEIKPPEKLIFTWNSEMVKDTRVTVEFSAKGNATELVLTHELFPSDEIREKHADGWNACLANLEKASA